jgi:FkbM family methyltransferase
MRVRRILVYGEMDVHMIDGSSIWLVSTVEALRRAGCEVTLLLRFPPQSDRLLKALSALGGITVIDPSVFPNLPGAEELKSNRGLTPDGAALAIEHLFRQIPFDAVIVRGSASARRLRSSNALRGRLWPYLTDLPQSVAELESQHRVWLAELAAASAVMLCQTEGIRALLESCVAGAGGKCELWPPMVPDLALRTEHPSHAVGTRDEPLRLGYMGKFAPRWNTLEMAALPAQLRERGLHALVDMVGDKAHPSPERPGWSDAMRQALGNAEGLRWHRGLPRDEALHVIATCHLGLSWRSRELDGSLELSTKLLEYGAIGLPAVVNRTWAHEELLGRDYPLFVDERRTVLDVIEHAVRNREDLHAAAQRLSAAACDFRMDKAVLRVRGLVERVLPDLERVGYGVRAGEQRPRVAIAGYDLKFMERLAARIEGFGAFEIRWDRRASGQQRETDAGRQCLDWADVVICEWCGGNAVWYSHNLRPEQRLIVRLHRYELERPWPLELNHDRVDRLICVSDHTAQNARALMPMLADRIEVIENWVDVEQLDRLKLHGAEFTIGLLGASVPRKGLMRALDIMEHVRAREPRFHLSIKSELPWRLPWWGNRQQDRGYFVSAMERIADSPLLRGAITFEDHGQNVASWFRRIGWVLSTSDNESFHLAPAEGAASGAVPVVLNWSGAADVHGSEVVHDSPECAAQWILDRHADGSRDRHAQQARHHVRARYALEDVAAKWTRMIIGLAGSGRSAAARSSGVPRQDASRAAAPVREVVGVMRRVDLVPVRSPAGVHAPALGAVQGALWRWSRGAHRRVDALTHRHRDSMLARSLRGIARVSSSYLRPRRHGFVLSDYGVWLRERQADTTFRMCLLGAYGCSFADFLDMQREPFCFIDGGANIGLFSLIALQNEHCVAVHAYEPDPATLPILRDNLARSGRSDWHVHPIALSRSSGIATLVRIPGHSGGSSIVRAAGAGVEAVAVTCVDGTHIREQTERESAPLILKLDVEGAEHLALEGLLSHVGARIRAAWIEFSRSSDRAASVALMHQHGFEEVARIGKPHLYDALWVPRDARAPQAWMDRVTRSAAPRRRA